MLLRVLRPPLHVRADRRRRRVEDRHLVLLDDRPPAVLVGEVGRPLVEDRRRPVAERPVDDVAVAGDPADVGGAPVDVLVPLQVEDVVVRRRRADEVAGRRVDDPLRLRGRAARVHEEEQVLAVHRLARTRLGIVRGVALEVVPPVVTALLHRHVAAGAAEDDAALHAGRVGHRLVGDVLSPIFEPRRHASSCVMMHLALHVVHPARERVGREAAEDDGVRRAEPGAREHRHRQLRDHAHVDPDRRPLLHAELLERVREADDVLLEIGVRDRARVSFGLALPVERDLVARAGLDVPVDAVEADVQLAAEIPLRVRRLPLVELGERLEPRDPLATLPLPELLERDVVDVGLARSPGPRSPREADSVRSSRNIVSIAWWLASVAKSGLLPFATAGS